MRQYNAVKDNPEQLAEYRIWNRQYQKARRESLKKEGGKRYENFRDSDRRNATKWALTKRTAVYEYLSWVVCEICGEKYHPLIYDFHHIDPNIKIKDISILVATGSIESLWKEMNKCAVLCSNCHRALHKGLVEHEFY